MANIKAGTEGLPQNFDKYDKEQVSEALKRARIEVAQGSSEVMKAKASTSVVEADNGVAVVAKDLGVENADVQASILGDSAGTHRKKVLETALNILQGNQKIDISNSDEAQDVTAMLEAMSENDK